MYTEAALACISSDIYAMEKEATSNKLITRDAIIWKIFRGATHCKWRPVYNRQPILS